MVQGLTSSQVKLTALDSLNEVRQKSLEKLAKAQDNNLKVIGIYCTYCPRELILAMDAIPVGLCGTREKPITAAERDLPRNLCPLIKSSYGFAITDTCPFFHVSDMIVGETTCDGKKKMFEVLSSKGIKDIYVMSLPQMPEGQEAIDLWVAELKKLKMYLENRYNVKITDENIRKAIRITNEEKRTLKALYDLNKNIPALITGMDLLKISWQISFRADRENTNRLIQDLIDEINDKATGGYHVGDVTTKRILLTGTPIGIGSEKVLNIIEESGALMVAMENCGGYKTVDLLIDEDENSDPLLSMAKVYLKIPCSVMSPNKDRMHLLKRMIKDFKVDGVIDLDWQACHTYNIESYFISDLVRNELGLPFLQLETDYSQSDVETLRVRIEAFLETVKAGSAL